MSTARRHYFLVADSIGDEEPPDEILATLVRLMAHMHQRWRTDGLTPAEACHIEIGPKHLAHITNRSRRDISLTLASHLADYSSMSVERRGDVVVIDWPKFAEYQKLHARDSDQNRTNVGSPVPVPVPKKKKPPIPLAGKTNGKGDEDEKKPGGDDLANRDLPDDFELFWRCYPRRIGKQAARKAWATAKDRPDITLLLVSLDEQKASEQWTKENGQFIPHPATWLNQSRWTDELPVPPVDPDDPWETAPRWKHCTNPDCPEPPELQVHPNGACPHLNTEKIDAPD